LRQRIGVYGGTFDPPHLGHLTIAERLVEAFSLDRMLLVPAATPPHKREMRISSPLHRFAMLALATGGSPRLFLSSIEIEAAQTPYTVDTLRLLQRSLPEARLFFVMGGDSFRDVTSWYQYEELLTGYDVVVAMRPGLAGVAEQGGCELTDRLPAHIHRSLLDLRGGILPTEEQLEKRHIYLTDYVSVDVSATSIREAVTLGLDVTGMVPPAVAAYLDKYQLYPRLP
jgi:nicotinate-nucleotide adenylyltransferase